MKRKVIGRLERTRTKLLHSYYGHPAKDLKIICIAGSTGKATIARYVHEILKAADFKTAVLASDGNLKPTLFHKFLSDAWKNNINYVVITASKKDLEHHVFDNLPLHLVAISDNATKNILGTEPELVVLNRDSEHYKDYEDFKGLKDTLTYGTNRSSLVKIGNSKLYKMGAEVTLTIGTKSFDVATFVPGEPAVSYMACAAACATALHISSDMIIEGISNYLPE